MPCSNVWQGKLTLRMRSAQQTPSTPKWSPNPSPWCRGRPTRTRTASAHDAMNWALSAAVGERDAALAEAATALREAVGADVAAATTALEALTGRHSEITAEYRDLTSRHRSSPAGTRSRPACVRSSRPGSTVQQQLDAERGEVRGWCA